MLKELDQLIENNSPYNLHNIDQKKKEKKKERETVKTQSGSKIHVTKLC